MVERIRQLCADRGITLKRLELEAGIGNGVIARWETSSPRADKLLAVAKVLNVSAEYLLTGNEKQPTDTGGLSDDELILLSAFRSLTKDQRQFVLRQLRAAAQAPEDQGASE